MNQVWKQFRGAGIGAHISPSLSNLAVTIVERTWAYTFRDAINSPSLAFMGLRYVDNRFVLFQAFGPQPRLQSWLTHYFTNSRSNLSQLTPRNSWGFLWIIEIAPQIRDVYSAGSLRLRLSGLRSRAHSITRYTFPCTDVPRSIEQLLLYISEERFFIQRLQTCTSKKLLSLQSGWC